MADRFDEMAAELHKEWEWPVEARVLAEALRETGRAAARRGELKGLGWARKLALGSGQAFDVERAITARIAEIKKGGG